MKQKLLYRKGFTLLEMLIVVAIIAILVAIAIPVFSASMEKSKAATCMANRRSLDSVLYAEYASGQLTAEEVGAISLTPENGYDHNGAAYVCPSGGKITVTLTDNIISVRCDYHKDGQTGNVPAWNNESAKKMWAVIKDCAAGVGSEDTANQKYIDLMAALEKNNIDLDELKATSWQYVADNDGNYFQWTTADITDLPVNTEITVIRYRMDKKYSEVYSVWKGKVNIKNGVKYVDTYNNSGDEYTGKMTMEQKKDIDNVIPYYNDNAKGFDPLP